MMIVVVIVMFIVSSNTIIMICIIMIILNYYHCHHQHCFHCFDPSQVIIISIATSGIYIYIYVYNSRSILIHRHRFFPEIACDLLPQCVMYQYHSSTCCFFGSFLYRRNLPTPWSCIPILNSYWLTQFLQCVFHRFLPSAPGKSCFISEFTGVNYQLCRAIISYNQF